MVVGRRLREIRELMSLSQGDIETSTGLLRCYISRVENGHTIPSLETLEKWASGLNIPLYRVFYDGKGLPRQPKPDHSTHALWGNLGRQVTDLERLKNNLKRMDDHERKALLWFAAGLIKHSGRKHRRLAKIAGKREQQTQRDSLVPTSAHDVNPINDVAMNSVLAQ